MSSCTITGHDRFWPGWGQISAGEAQARAGGRSSPATWHFSSHCVQWELCSTSIERTHPRMSCISGVVADLRWQRACCWRHVCRPRCNSTQTCDDWRCLAACWRNVSASARPGSRTRKRALQTHATRYMYHYADSAESHQRDYTVHTQCSVFIARRSYASAVLGVV